MVRQQVVTIGRCCFSNTIFPHRLCGEKNAFIGEAPFVFFCSLCRIGNKHVLMENLFNLFF
jgi:hypothetical protein